MTLNRNQLKYLVIVAMLMDHIAWAYVPTNSIPAFFLHLIGRTTGPTMAFFLAEGFYYSKNIKAYACRLGIFSLISWPAFTLFEFGELPLYREGGHWQIHYNFPVLFTLFLSLIALWVWYKSSYSKSMKHIIVLCLAFLTVSSDWGVLDMMFAFYFYENREDKKKLIRGYLIFGLIFSILSLLGSDQFWFGLSMFGVLFVALLISKYNGEKGSDKPIHKWFFYVFYPLHLLIIWGIGRMI